MFLSLMRGPSRLLWFWLVNESEVNCFEVSHAWSIVVESGVMEGSYSISRNHTSHLDGHVLAGNRTALASMTDYDY